MIQFDLQLLFVNVFMKWEKLSSRGAQVLRTKTSKTLFGPVNFSVFFKNYTKINSRIWFEPVNSNFHFEDWKRELIKNPLDNWSILGNVIFTIINDNINPYHAELFWRNITKFSIFCFFHSVVEILVDITPIFTENYVSWVYFDFPNFGDTFYHGCHDNIFFPVIFCEKWIFFK